MPDMKPLLLLDNSSANTVINEGEFKCHNLTFAEAKGIIETYDASSILLCFNDKELENVIYNYLSIEDRDFEYKKIRNMRPGQDAIVFKLYITPSETQPIIHADGVEAKKIQNVYVYCQYLSRMS